MIGVLGISHKSASLEIRELFSISKEEIAEIGELILKDTEASETVIISTCNRTEIYYYHQKSCARQSEKQLRSIIHQFKNIPADYSDYFYSHFNSDAVNHLFSVTSGLKSMVFGEDQIVCQVKEAYVHCTNLAYTDAVLMRLFQKSFEAGKRVRTETNIQKGATSVAYAAVEQCALLISDWEDKKILLIGTGETGRLIIQKLKKLGANNFYFSNRTFENALQMAQENDGKAIQFDAINEYLSDSDIIITATSAGTILISKSEVESALEKRKYQDQVYIDLSVPRNIDPKVETCQNINLLTVDSLQTFVEKNAEKRKLSENDAEKIIREMVIDFFAWYDNRTLRPVIKAISTNMQKLHDLELEKYRKNYSPEMLEAVDEYAGRLTQKYIRTLIKNLRELNENGDATHSLKTINTLFEFESEKNKSGLI